MLLNIRRDRAHPAGTIRILIFTPPARMGHGLAGLFDSERLEFGGFVESGKYTRVKCVYRRTATQPAEDRIRVL
jgi:hypothetical protein